MSEFEPLPSSFGEWTQPVDILVIGDSFANLRPAQQWQNHLVARTGWRVHVAAIFAQLGVNSRSAALLAAQRMGLVAAPSHDLA